MLCRHDDTWGDALLEKGASKEMATPPVSCLPLCFLSFLPLQNAFDHEKAQKEGKITPEEGVDEEFDAAVSELKVSAKEAEVVWLYQSEGNLG